MAIDVAADRLYWSELFSFGRRFFQATLEGGGAREIVFNPELFGPGANDLSVDTTSGRLYWVEGGCTGDVCISESRIMQAETDGWLLEQLQPETPLSGPQGIALDPVERKIYWIERGGAGIHPPYTPGAIRRANLDGSEAETLYLGFPWQAMDLDIDVAGRKIYWTIQEPGRIARAALDGSNLEVLINLGAATPIGIAIDSEDEKIYWTEGDGWGELPGKILRANLDGSAKELLISTTGLRTIPTRIVVVRK